VRWSGDWEVRPSCVTFPWYVEIEIYDSDSGSGSNLKDFMISSDCAKGSAEVCVTVSRVVCDYNS
jgi:hypothetical protein